MTKAVTPTRKELMQIDDRIDLSERGHNTLEKKRGGLIMHSPPRICRCDDQVNASRVAALPPRVPRPFNPPGRSWDRLL